MPTFDQLMQPILTALAKLGGSGNISEIYNKVVELENFGEEILNVIHRPGRDNRTEIGYLMGWARSYLKKAGYLENSSRGVWALTEKARNSDPIDGSEIAAHVRALDRHPGAEPPPEDEPEDPATTDNDLPEENQTWREELYHILIEKMTPDAFERLTQRLLRESGFISVEVTGRTGDGGIDGTGIARINGLMSFRIAFQCKKYQGSVPVADMRNFRGAITGRADRGIFITTGNFTQPAIEEANRDGVAPIDLVDGEQLADKLKELALGVKTEMVEKVTVDPEWFLNL